MINLILFQLEFYKLPLIAIHSRKIDTNEINYKIQDIKILTIIFAFQES
jgi:hypothetical protein